MQQDVIVQSGGKYNLSQGLNRRSRQQSGSRECVTQGPGAALKGLDTALEQIALQQKKEDAANAVNTTYVAKVSSSQNTVNGDPEVPTVTLPLSQRASRAASRAGSRVGSRANSVTRDQGARRSRRGSLDIYTAEYALKIGGGQKKSITGMEQKTAFHMKVENEDDSDMVLCGRCHLPTHRTGACTEFGTVSCPRCLDWGHWEDSCHTLDGANPTVCQRCSYTGHTEAVHDTEDFNQRRAVVDAVGWEPFQNWFYEQTFRGWWQVTGCVGVPLYRIYPRKTEWRTEKPPVQEENIGKSSLERADSVDDMIAQVKLLNQRRALPAKEDDDSSGRSTPAHLKEDSTSTNTFKDTLKGLDSEILSELDVK